MLELDSLQLRNFMSYGDYWTTVPLAGMGQCLIVGEVLGGDEVADNTGWVEGEILERMQEHNDVLLNSNGAGKSALVNGLLWCLFGRTMHSAAPGNKVINHFTGRDCVTRVSFKSGDSITRVRTTAGRTELIMVRGGNQVSWTADTLSTTQLLQSKLNKEFGLDWDIFCGSVCFSQYGRTWLEMPDNQRKQALERMLRVDRYSFYAQVAKEKTDKIGLETESRRQRMANIRSYMDSLTEQIQELQQERAQFETHRAERQQEQLAAATAALQQRDAIQLPDRLKLQQKWALVRQIEDRLQAMARESDQLTRQGDLLRTEIASQHRIIQDCERRIEQWRTRVGKICVECEQELPHQHVEDVKVAPQLAERATATAHLQQLQQQAGTKQAAVRQLTHDRVKFTDKLQLVRPPLSLEQVELLYRNWEHWDRVARQAGDRARQIALETNPIGSSISKHEAKHAELAAELEQLTGAIEQYNVLFQHYNYISSSYRDRRKIKSYVFAEYIPFINSRLDHYSDLFNLDINLKFSDSLAITSDKWGYDFFCGGERKRADLALMLAAFDLNEFMYGRQCNVVILDEVDSRLDMSGVDSLVQIIKNDLAQKVETVLIISHRSTLLDLFPRHINVKRQQDRLSYVEEIR